ncbi:Retrovirus-related Pol polyprotein from transposon RE1 [Linum perenne]
MATDHSSSQASPTVTPTATLPPATDPSSVYFIHPSENWGQCLVSAVLTETNFTSWERSMALVLAGKNKLGFVNGAIPTPTPTDPLFPLWTRNNQLLLSWIQRSVSPSIMQSILWIESARDVWCELKERFSQGDVFRIADLQERIFSFKQSNLSISEYFTQLKALWDELANFRSIPACECTPICSCILAPIRAYHHSDFVIRFLRGLSESFSAARASVMLMDPLPSVNRVFSMMLQQERQLQSSFLPVSHTENMAFVSRAASNLAPRPAGFKNKGKRPVCSYCNYVGHTAEVCYKKNGYPPGYKPRPRLQAPTQSQAHCVASFPSDQSQNVTSTMSDAPVTLSRSDWTQFQQQYNRMAQIVQQPQAQVVHQTSVSQRPPSPYTSPQHIHDGSDVTADLTQAVRVNSVVSDQPDHSAT